MRRCAKVGITVHVSAPRTFGSSWTMALRGVCVRSQWKASCCARRQRQRPVEAGAHPMVVDVLGVVGVDDRGRQADGEDERRRAATVNGRDADQPAGERARDQRRQHDQHDLAGAPADPDRIAIRQAARDRRARRRRRGRPRPGSAAPGTGAATGRPGPAAAPGRSPAAASRRDGGARSRRTRCAARCRRPRPCPTPRSPRPRRATAASAAACGSSAAGRLRQSARSAPMTQVTP